MHIWYRNVQYIEPFSFIYYLPKARLSLALLIFFFLSPPSRIPQLENQICVKTLCPPITQKVHKKRLSQSISSITSASIGALDWYHWWVIFIIVTHLFCSYVFLLLLGIFPAFISLPFYIMPLTYPVQQPLQQTKGLYKKIY